ncbi:MAG: hypothetical protein ACTSQK_05965 [Candidatus Heimdallarchaeota archaeon]
MRVQDVITYNQVVTKRIKDKEVSKYFYDKDYGLLLTFLRTGPKTIKEIEEAYAAEGNEKSDKTLYRYIKTLGEVGLAVEAGKRIFTDKENRNKSVSIFMRTAMVFFDDTNVDQATTKANKKKIFQAYKLLLDQVDENKTFTKECIETIMEKLIKAEELAIEFIQNSDEKVFDLLKGQDFTEINAFIQNISWLIMIYNSEIKETLKSC